MKKMLRDRILTSRHTTNVYRAFKEHCEEKGTTMSSRVNLLIKKDLGGQIRG